MWIVALLGYKLLSARLSILPQIPLALFVVFFFIRFLMPFAEKVPWFSPYLQWVEVSDSVILAWAIARLAFWIIVETPVKFKYKRELPKITRDLVLIIIFTILFVIVLHAHSNINLISLATTSAALTVVLGIAAQTSLRSFFAGLIFQFERPYKVGDWIQQGDYEGEVIGITWRSTHLLTREKAFVYIPNDVIFGNTFKNFSKPDEINIGQLKIGLEYRASPNKVNQIAMRVVNRHPRVVKNPPPEIWLRSFGDFAIKYEIRFGFRNRKYEHQIKAELNKQLWYSLQRSRIRIPFPIRDLRFAHIEHARKQKKHKAFMAEIEKTLVKVPVLKPLSPQNRSQIARHLSIKKYAAGEQIVEQNEAGDSLCIIWSGKCEVLVQIEGRKPARIATLQKGDFFGEMSLLTGEPHKATVCALESSSIFIIDKKLFAKILTANPSISELIGKAMAKREAELDKTGSMVPQKEETASHTILKIKAFFGLK